MKHFLGGLLAVVAGCSDPANVEGTWTVALTNRDNGCSFGNWTVGESATNVQVVFTQNGESVNADVQGLAEIGLALLLGADGIFSGSVDGDELDLVREGTNPTTMGNCTFTYNAQILATVSGGTMEGRIEYRAQHNNNSDCAAVTCLTYQDFNGVRPPP
jgi:hypothetical protein